MISGWPTVGSEAVIVYWSCKRRLDGGKGQLAVDIGLHDRLGRLSRRVRSPITRHGRPEPDCGGFLGVWGEREGIEKLEGIERKWKEKKREGKFGGLGWDLNENIKKREREEKRENTRERRKEGNWFGYRYGGKHLPLFYFFFIFYFIIEYYSLIINARKFSWIIILQK